VGIIIRQSIKSSLVSYLGVAIGIFNALWLSIHFLQPDQIALTRVLGEGALLFAIFAQLGTTQISDRFFPHFKNDEQKHHGFLVFLLLYPLIGFLIFCLLTFLFKNALLGYYLKKAPLLNNYLYYVVPLTFFMMYQNILESYSRIHLRIVVPTIIRELFLKITNGVLISLYAFHYLSFDAFVGLTVASYGVAVVLLTFYIGWLGKLYIRFDLSQWNFPLFRQVVYFGLFIILGGVGVLLTTKIDVLMLPALSGLSNTGVYVIATFMASVIEIPKRSISQISAPLISQALKQDNLTLVSELYRKTSINQLLAGLFLSLGIWCNIDLVFDLMPNGELYRQGKYVVGLLGLSKLIDMGTGANAEIITYSRYYRFSMITMLVLALLTVLTNYLFIPLYGITGAALATALSIFVFTLIKCWFVWYRFRMQPFTTRTLYAILMAGAIYAAVLIIPSFNQSIIQILLSMAARSAVITVLFAALTLRLRISKDVNLVTHSLYHKVWALIR
jgi:O-antigen/teichoic acid export membrane protein